MSLLAVYRLSSSLYPDPICSVPFVLFLLLWYLAVLAIDWSRAVSASPPLSSSFSCALCLCSLLICLPLVFAFDVPPFSLTLIVSSCFWSPSLLSQAFSGSSLSSGVVPGPSGHRLVQDFQHRPYFPPLFGLLYCTSTSPFPSRYSLTS